MTPCWMFLAILAAAIPCAAQDAADTAPAPLVVESKPVATNRTLLHKYIYATLGVDGVIHATLTSGLAQWKHSPPEWGLDARGYATRWGSDYAEAAIGNAAKYSVARLLHQDPSFTVCECSGVSRRLLHALKAPFRARRRDGTWVWSGASLAGFLTGRVVSSSTWYPATHGARDGLQDGAMSLLSTLGMDVAKEFRPKRRSPG